MTKIPWTDATWSPNDNMKWSNNIVCLGGDVFGTSISTQADADKNIPILLQIPAAVRFISLEPLLPGLIDVTRYLLKSNYYMVQCGCGWIGSSEHLAMFCIDNPRCPECHSPHVADLDDNNGLDQVIISCESGPGARLCSLDDIRYVRDQCKEARVPVFINQIPVNGKCNKNPDEWPQEFQIQEYPK